MDLRAMYEAQKRDIEDLKARVSVIERGGLSTLETLTVVAREDEGLGRPKQYARERRHVLNPGQAYVPEAKAVEIVELASSVQGLLTTLVNNITAGIELAAKADKRAEYAAVQSGDVIDLVCAMADALGVHIGLDPETKRLSITGIAANSADVVRLSQENRQLREERDLYRDFRLAERVDGHTS